MENNQEVTQQPVDSSDDFFAAIENLVNSSVYDTAEDSSEVGPEKETQAEEGAQVGEMDWESENNPYKKRYGDSTKGAQELYKELNELKPFVPILNAMKQDNNLVQYVKDYLIKGGAPAKSIQQDLGVAEDFEFDANEAVTNKQSDSAKVLDAHVDAVVNKKIQGMVQSQIENVKKAEVQESKKNQELEFKKKYNMSDEDFSKMVGKAKEHTMSLEDIHYLVNKEKIEANIANSTKEEMMKQMQNVKNIPQTIGSVNSLGTTSKSDDDKIFDSILSSEENLDSLFG